MKKTPREVTALIRSLVTDAIKRYEPLEDDVKGKFPLADLCEIAMNQVTLTIAAARWEMGAHSESPPHEMRFKTFMEALELMLLSTIHGLMEVHLESE